MRSEEILIVAGEASGDIHAAPVVSEIRKLAPAVSFFGSGGSKMVAEGVELLAGIENLAVMGFTDIPRILPLLSRLKKDILANVHRRRVKLAILVDYPGFNLNLAKALKRLPDPPLILEYIAPQVWAWRAGRMKTIRRVIDHLAVVFPFEEKLFRDAGINATCVGHPLIDELDAYIPKSMNKTTLKSRIRLGDGKKNPLLALLPGSRESVVKRHLPVMIDAAEDILQEVPGLQAGIGKAPGIPSSLFDNYLQSSRIKIWENSRKLLSEADAAVICSGTSTLEAALIGIPQVVVYKTSLLNYHVIKRLINLPHVALANIVASDLIVPELLQGDFTPQNIADNILRYFRENHDIQKVYEGYLKIRSLLGEKGAAVRVAEIAFRMLSEKV